MWRETLPDLQKLSLFYYNVQSSICVYEIETVFFFRFFFKFAPKMLSFLRYGNKCYGGIEIWDLEVITDVPNKDWGSPISKNGNSKGFEMAAWAPVGSSSCQPFLLSPHFILAASRSGLQEKEKKTASCCCFRLKKPPKKLIGLQKRREGRGWWFHIKGENIFGFEFPPLWTVAPDQIKSTMKWI